MFLLRFVKCKISPSTNAIKEKCSFGTRSVPPPLRNAKKVFLSALQGLSFVYLNVHIVGQT